VRMSKSPRPLTFSICDGSVGSGRLGYIGDLEFGELG